MEHWKLSNWRKKMDFFIDRNRFQDATHFKKWAWKQYHDGLSIENNWINTDPDIPRDSRYLFKKDARECAEIVSTISLDQLEDVVYSAAIAHIEFSIWEHQQDVDRSYAECYGYDEAQREAKRLGRELMPDFNDHWRDQLYAGRINT